MISDEEIKSRLMEVSGFEPWDKFQHCLYMLRKGYVYVVDHRYPIWHKNATWGFFKWKQRTGRKPVLVRA